jgi:Flp pilus assembly protein TadG
MERTMVNPCKRGWTLIRRFGREPRGLAAIEFAFVGPALILAILAIFSCGGFFYTQSAIDDEIEQVLREAAIEKDLTGTEVETRLHDHLDRFGADQLTIDATYSVATETAPRLLTVNVQYSFEPIGPLSSVAFPINVTGQIPIID